MAFAKLLLYIAPSMNDVNQIPILITNLYKYWVYIFKTKLIVMVVTVLLTSHSALCKDHPWYSTYSTLVMHDQYFTVEIADTAATLERGLMDRRALALDAGMLFVFKKLIKPTFWMKNTYIALDLLFIDEQGQVLCAHHHAVPLSLTKLTCPLPCKAVLEVNAGILHQFNIQPGDFITKIDLKDAYVVVPIHQRFRKYLSFLHGGTVYRYRPLAFDLSVAPRVFSKLIKYAIEPLRKAGIRMVYYLDDLCFLTTTKEETTKVMKTALQHLQKLGFIINWKKNQLEPTHQQDFLGFEFNTVTMKIRVPKPKMENLHQRIKQVQKKNPRSCRWIASLLGKITAMISAIGEALLRIRFI